MYFTAVFTSGRPPATCSRSVIDSSFSGLFALSSRRYADGTSVVKDNPDSPATRTSSPAEAD